MIINNDRVEHSQSQLKIFVMYSCNLVATCFGQNRHSPCQLTQHFTSTRPCSLNRHSPCQLTQHFTSTRPCSLNRHSPCQLTQHFTSTRPCSLNRHSPCQLTQHFTSTRPCSLNQNIYSTHFSLLCLLFTKTGISLNWQYIYNPTYLLNNHHPVST